MLENSVKEYIERRLRENGETLSEQELEGLVNDITCTVADVIDLELNEKLDK